MPPSRPRSARDDGAPRGRSRLRTSLTDGELLEWAWQADIIQSAKLHGWRAMHIYDSRRATGEGWPDLVLAKAGLALVVPELKRWDGIVSVRQQEWMNLLVVTASAIECYVWRADLAFSGNHVTQEIDRLLARPQCDPSDVSWSTTRWLGVPEDSRLVRHAPGAKPLVITQRAQARQAARLAKLHA